MDPNTATRLEFTNHLIYAPIDDDASPKWARLVENHKTLLDALAHHDAMKPNLYQTYMTPAADKNKVYFEWDFVGRTLVCRPSFPLACLFGLLCGEGGVKAVVL